MAGELHNVQALYSDHHGWLQSWLRRKLGNALDAADIEQDVFVRVLSRQSAAPAVEALNAPRAYLSTIARGVDAAGNAFKPSDGRQVELGLKYMPADRKLSFAAALFNLEKSDVVSYDPSTFEARQIGKVRSRGLEMEAKAELTPQWKLIASWTLLDMKVLASANDAEIGKTPILTPEQTAALWLDYGFPTERGAWGLGGGLRYIGKRWNDEANTSSEPAYTLFDAAVHYDQGPWRVALNVTNLFDKRYYSGAAYGSFFRGAERNAVLSARYRF